MAVAPVPPASASGSASQPAPAAQPPLSEAARIVNTFIAPSKTFTDLRRNASWWAPFLLFVVASTIFSCAVGQKVGYSKAGEYVLQTRPKQWDRIQNMKTDDREKT